MPPAAAWSPAELHGMGRGPSLPIDASECVWAEISSAEWPWGSARTHAEGVMWPPPGRTWTCTGGTSGARMTSAEDKKSLKTVRSHAIPTIPFRCFRLRLGRNPFRGEAMGPGANPCRRSHVAGTRTHLAAHRRDQRLLNSICRGQEIGENGKESCDS